MYAFYIYTETRGSPLLLVAKPPGVLRSVPTFLKISHILDIYNIIQDFTTKAELIMILTTRVWQHVTLAPCDAENDTIHPLQHPGDQYWSWNIGYDISDRNDENSAGNWDFITTRCQPAEVGLTAGHLVKVVPKLTAFLNKRFTPWRLRAEYIALKKMKQIVHLAKGSSSRVWQDLSGRIPCTLMAHYPLWGLALNLTWCLHLSSRLSFVWSVLRTTSDTACG